MAVSNATDGMGIKVVCDRDRVVHHRNFAGSFLSPLNTNEIWVENLTTGDDTSVRYALLLPLVREIGVLEVQYSGATGEWTTQLWPMEMDGVEGSCQTLFIHRFKNALYSVCIFKTGPGSSSSLRLYEITLNTGTLGESSVRYESFATLNGDRFTNVVYAQREQNDQYFFVIIDGGVAYIDPSDHERTLYPLGYDEECTNVTFLQYVVLSSDLLVHLSCCTEDQTCSRRGIYYNTYREKSLELSEGLPYRCPDFETEVVIHESTNQFHVRGMNYELEGDGFRHGLCSGSSSNPWFAYQDDTGQIFVTDLSPSTTPTLQRVSERGCLEGPNCSPIRNVSDILVIQEFDQESQLILAKGIHPFTSNSVVFELYNPQPNLFALLNVPFKFTLLPATTAVPNTAAISILGTTNSPYPTPTQKTNITTVVAVVVPLVVLTLVVLVLAIVVIAQRRLRHNYFPQKANRDENGQDENGQDCFTPVPAECQDGGIALVQQEAQVYRPEAGQIGGEGDIVAAAQPEDTGGARVDVVHGKSKVTNPTLIDKRTVYENLHDRQRTEDRRNDCREKVNYIDEKQAQLQN